MVKKLLIGLVSTPGFITKYLVLALAGGACYSFEVITDKLGMRKLAFRAWKRERKLRQTRSLMLDRMQDGIRDLLEGVTSKVSLNEE